VTLRILPSVAAPQGSSEAISLNSTSVGGITVSFSPQSPVQLQGNKALNVTLRIVASTSTKPGNYTLHVQGVSGANMQTDSFIVQVVQNLVFMTNGAFSPSNLNVTTGSTVFWMDLDGPGSACGASGFGPHNAVFTTLAGANSPSMTMFSVYSYTFTKAGTYFYYSALDTDHLMNGTITVTG
jgi:plastocyanin